MKPSCTQQVLAPMAFCSAQSNLVIHTVVHNKCLHLWHSHFSTNWQDLLNFFALQSQRFSGLSTLTRLTQHSQARTTSPIVPALSGYQLSGDCSHRNRNCFRVLSTLTSDSTASTLTASALTDSALTDATLTDTTYSASSPLYSASRALICVAARPR